jgi:hypothetical protein
MKKVIIKNKAGIQTHSAQLENPAEWISNQVERNSWGLAEREVEESLCSGEEKASALSSRTETDLDGVERTYYTLPATYTIEITDISDEVKQQAIDSWITERNNQCDKDIELLLNPMEDVTHLMLAMFEIYTATNISGTNTPEEIAAAKANLASYLDMLAQVQALRYERDNDISAYLLTQ